MQLQPIYDAIGENKVQAIGGCAPQAISLRQAKHRGGSVFFKSNDSVIRSLTVLGKGPEPTKEVFEGCEELICRVLRVKHLLQRRSYSGMYSAVETIRRF